MKILLAKELKFYTEDFLEKEQTRNIECKVQNSICESLIERKNKNEIGKEKLQVGKMQLYEKHKQGIIDKEAYLFQK